MGISAAVIGNLIGRRMMSSRVSVEKAAVSPWLRLRPKADRVFHLYNLEDESEVKLRGPVEVERSKIVGCSYGWLVSLERSLGWLYLYNPVTGQKLKLPPITTLPDSYQFVSRVVVSDDQRLAFAIYGAYRSLAVCVPGQSHSWSLMRSPFVRYEEFVQVIRSFQNVAYSSRRNTLFSISTVCTSYDKFNSGSAEIESWDLTSPTSPTADLILGPNFKSTHHFKLLNFDSESYEWPARSAEASLKKRFECLKFKYLVVDEACDQLFLVVRHVVPRMHTDGSSRDSIFYSDYGGWDRNYAHKTVDFDVYKIDVDGKVMSHMEDSLDGLALFVGLSHPFVVRPALNSPLKPNSIYFTDLPDHVSWYYKDHDNGVFDYLTKTFSACHNNYPIDICKLVPKRRSINQIINHPLPFWFTPVESTTNN